MGTFHSHKGELHGITVLVRTPGPRVYIGRCDEYRPDGIVLLDVDHHDDGEDGRTTAEYIDRAYRLGVFPRHPQLKIPTPQITSVTPLHLLGASERSST